MKKHDTTNPTMRHAKFTNVLESMFKKVSSNFTTGAELNILKKDINKTTYEVEEEFHKVIPDGGKFRKEFLKKEMSKSIRGKEAIMVSLADDVIVKLKKKQSMKAFPSPRKSIQDSTKQSSFNTLKHSLDTGLTSIIESPNKNSINTPTRLPQISERSNSPARRSVVGQRRSSILSQIVNQHRQSICVTSASDKKSEILNIKNTFNNMTKDIKEVIRMPRMSICIPTLNFRGDNQVNEHLMRDHGVGMSNMGVSAKNHELVESYMRDKNEKKMKEMEELDEKFYQERFGHAMMHTVDNETSEDILKFLEIKKAV